MKNQMTFKNWIIKAANIFGLMVPLICVYFIVSSKFTGGSPQVFGYQFMTILSGSMEPEIDRGSVILIKSIKDQTELRQGDVITFHSPIDQQQLITHRIDAILGEGMDSEFITKGDANLTPDARALSADSIVGKYQGIALPYLGHMVEFMKSKWGLIIFLIIPAIYIVVSNIKYLQTAVSRSKEEIH